MQALLALGCFDEDEQVMVVGEDVGFVLVQS